MLPGLGKLVRVPSVTLPSSLLDFRNVCTSKWDESDGPEAIIVVHAIRQAHPKHVAHINSFNPHDDLMHRCSPFSTGEGTEAKRD